ncbi:MAG: metal-dependent transcriptional regulator [Candidatus Lokiarchaeota archaeon]|nr:metal-dependent transcriptional regulator [Candidatus Lokiarchaeota archaeon]
MAKETDIQDVMDVPESYQRYLDEIYNITYKKKKGGWVSNKEIAEALHVNPASVSGMLDKLKKQGLISWEQRKAIRLTKQGKEIAEHLSSVHALLNDFFEKVLKLEDLELIDGLSCQIEHHITREVKISLENFLERYLSK